MKISFNWLRDYIEIKESPENIADLLTRSGLEVASTVPLEPRYPSLRGLLIGQVVTHEKHPNADRLHVTQVDIGQNTPLHIVCGAPNVQAGQKVIVAPIGAQLHPQRGPSYTIRKTTIRGQVSEGMLCAEDEVGVGNAHEGIITLNTTLPPGTPAIQYFETSPDDTIFEIDLTPNRGDACSHFGTARELRALLDRPVQLPSVAPFKEGTRDFPLQVEILQHGACLRYAGLVINNVQVKPSPQWLRERLEGIGVKSINNIVDVTNFVAHELGQPLHAFDYNKIVGRRITLQTLQAGTPFITLEGITRELKGTELMICDQEGGMSMAGILGGQRTSIQPDTQNIFLESAYFDPSVIRSTAKQHALSTEASYRFERGVDPAMTLYALKRACLLLQDIAEGHVLSRLMDLYPEKIAPHVIRIHYKNITRLLGIKITPTTIKNILRRLDIDIFDEEKDGFMASVPPYRTDVTREVDIIEEIVRIYGYDHIPTKDSPSSTYLAGATRPERHTWQQKIAELLVANGCQEIYTNSFTKPAYTTFTDVFPKQQQVTVANPSSETMRVLRQTLLFSGLEVMVHNHNRKNTDLKLFEFGTTYHQQEQYYVERRRLGLWFTGYLEGVHWAKKPQGVTLQDMHQLLYKVLYKLGHQHFITHAYKSTLYRRSLQITMGGARLLVAGEVHPDLLEYLGIQQAVFFADIDWELLLCRGNDPKQYQPISKFPPVTRDVSLVLRQSTHFSDIKKIIQQQNGPLIKEVTVVDVYQGEALETGKKAYTLRFTLQSESKTLDEETIEKTMAHLTHTLVAQLEAVVR